MYQLLVNNHDIIFTIVEFLVVFMQPLVVRPAVHPLYAIL